jgi:hypothetical protein
MITLAIRGWGLGISAAALLVFGSTGAAAQARDPSIRTNPANQTTPSTPAAQTNAPSGSNSELVVPPIECWWKTDRSAVRIGEHFMLTLTCAVLDTDRVRVVVDESALAPSALHLVPFDIVDGQRFRDILNAPRRFFQYQYTMRVLGEEFFGKEVTLPRLQVSYRVQNSLQGGAALAGREAQYSLVPVPIRVLSLVPPGTTDIRDTPANTFGDVEARLFRSNVLLIVATIAFVFAVLLAVLLLSRAAITRHRAAAARHRDASPWLALRAASRELGAVQTATQSDGWNSDLAGRAASALRLAGAVALSRPIGQKEVDRDAEPGEGQIAVARAFGRLKGKKTLLSAAVTPGSNATNGKPGTVPPAWTSLSQSLGVFTAARYSRPAADEGRNGGLDGTTLDTALAEGRDAVKRLRLSQFRRLGRARRRVEETPRPTWAR